MGPLGHLAVPLPVARLLKLNLAVVALCALLPDLVDYSLYALGIGSGRYIAHTLLFVFLVAIAFSIKRKIYGLSALFGGISHLLLDRNFFVPWFYPFVSYEFPCNEELGPFLMEFIHRYFSLSSLGKELIWVALIGAIVLLIWLSLRFSKRARSKVYHARQSNRTDDKEE